MSSPVNTRDNLKKATWPGAQPAWPPAAAERDPPPPVGRPHQL